MTTRSLTFPLTSNGYALSPDSIGWLIPTSPHQPLTALREQYQAQGYLWLKGILDRKAVLDFRERVFNAFLPTGLVDSR